MGDALTSYRRLAAGQYENSQIFCEYADFFQPEEQEFSTNRDPKVRYNSEEFPDIEESFIKKYELKKSTRHH